MVLVNYWRQNMKLTNQDIEFLRKYNQKRKTLEGLDMNSQEIEEYEKKRLQKGPLEKYEVQDFGLIGNTTHSLYVHNPEWEQPGISPACVIQDFYCEELDVQIKICGHYDTQKSTISDFKKEMANGLGFSTWTQMCRDQDKMSVEANYERLIQKIVGGEYEHAKS